VSCGPIDQLCEFILSGQHEGAWADRCAVGELCERGFATPFMQHAQDPAMRDGIEPGSVVSVVMIEIVLARRRFRNRRADRFHSLQARVSYLSGKEGDRRGGPTLCYTVKRPSPRNRRRVDHEAVVCA
jgi:hypothetical protein